MRVKDDTMMYQIYRLNTLNDLRSINRRPIMDTRFVTYVIVILRIMERNFENKKKISC